jgi:hypothetical protein
MPREFLRVTKEAVVGTYDTTPDPADVTWIRLDRDNAFRARPGRNFFTIRDHGGSNRKALSGTETATTVGTLSTAFYGSQAAILIPWATDIITTPWRLPTLTFDHAIQKEDSGFTYTYKRYEGATCRSMKIAASNEGDAVVCRLDFSFDYMDDTEVITVTDLPAPALSVYPPDYPMVFQNLAGKLNFGGVRTNFKSFEMNIVNINDVIHDESEYPQYIKWCGRDANAQAMFRYKAEQDRIDMTANTPKTFEVTFDDGTVQVLFDFFDMNRIRVVNDDLPMNRASYQTVEWDNHLDLTDLSDFAVTIS